MRSARSARISDNANPIDTSTSRAELGCCQTSVGRGSDGKADTSDVRMGNNKHAIDLGGIQEKRESGGLDSAGDV